MGANLRKLDWDQLDPVTLEGAGEVFKTVCLWHRAWFHGVAMAILALCVLASATLAVWSGSMAEAAQHLADFSKDITTLESLDQASQLDLILRERVGLQKHENQIRSADRGIAFKSGSAWTAVRREALASRVDQTLLRTAKSAADRGAAALKARSAQLSQTATGLAGLAILGMLGMAFLIRSTLRHGSTTLVVQSMMGAANRGFQSDISASTQRESDAITSAVNHLPAAIFEFESDGRILRWNREMERLTRIPAERAVSRNVIDCLGWTLTAEAAKSTIRKVFSGETIESLAWEFSPAPGMSLWLEARIMPVIDGGGAVRSCSATARDVTSERLGRELLNANDLARLALIKAIPDTLLKFDRAMGLVEVYDNRGIFGPDEAIRGSAWQKVFPADLQSMLAHGAKQARLTGKPFEFDYCGTVADRACNLVFRMTVSGTTDILAVVTDWSNRQKRPEVERDGAMSFQALVDASVDTVLTVSAEGIIVFASQSCQDLLGASPDSLVGRSWIELLHKDSRENGERLWADTLEGTGNLQQASLQMVGTGTAFTADVFAANHFGDLRLGAVVLTIREKVGIEAEPHRDAADADKMMELLDAICGYAEHGAFGCVLVTIHGSPDEVAMAAEEAGRQIAMSCREDDVYGMISTAELLAILPEASEKDVSDTRADLEGRLEHLNTRTTVTAVRNSHCQCTPASVLGGLRSGTAEAQPSAA